MAKIKAASGKDDGYSYGDDSGNGKKDDGYSYGDG